MMEMVPPFEHVRRAASAHLWCTNRCAEDKRGDGARDRFLESIPASSGSQIKKRKSKPFCPLEDDGPVCTVCEMRRTRSECALYQQRDKLPKYGNILLRREDQILQGSVQTDCKINNPCSKPKTELKGSFDAAL